MVCDREAQNKYHRDRWASDKGKSDRKRLIYNRCMKNHTAPIAKSLENYDWTQEELSNIKENCEIYFKKLHPDGMTTKEVTKTIVIVDYHTNRLFKHYPSILGVYAN